MEIMLLMKEFKNFIQIYIKIVIWIDTSDPILLIMHETRKVAIMNMYES